MRQWRVVFVFAVVRIASTIQAHYRACQARDHVVKLAVDTDRAATTCTLNGFTASYKRAIVRVVGGAQGATAVTVLE